MRLRWSPIKLAVLVVIAVAVLGLYADSTAKAGGPGARVENDPSFQNVAVGGTVSVDIVVANAPTFASYEFHLAFDPSLLEFVSVTGGGDILEDAGRDSLCLGPDAADLKNAIVSYGCASTGSTVTGPSGTGVLATITFDAVCPGQGELAFVPVGKDLSVDAVSLGSLLGESIDTQGVAGDVNINGVGCGVSNVLRGDANCSGSVNAIDSALILQISAGLLSELSCAANADANGNGSVDSIDAALILQFVAGLLPTL